MYTLVTTKSDDTTQEKDPRKPYEKPQVIYRAPLEAMAGVCLPAPGKASLGAPENCTNIQS